MDSHTLMLYFVVAFFYILSPGPAVFLAIYNGAMHGTRTVFASALGNILGLALLSTLSISGLSAILLSSSLLFIIVKTVGAGYLIYLGIRQFKAGNRQLVETKSTEVVSDRSVFSYCREGFYLAATNPKPILFFVALFPQFIDTTRPVVPQFFIMTLMFMGLSFMCLSSYGYLASRARHILSRSNVVGWFNRISGGLFVGMGTSLFYVKSTQ